ncbi:MAG: MmcQ/YjbR family DNA-binding protein [Myxococcales bacterium]|nr:MmcQ/YjbR family DNA-binding protein [Myxococcales bacterium]
MGDPTPQELLAAAYAQALGYPEAYEEEPWGHPAIKVRKKAFVFCSKLGADDPSLSVKLPVSGKAATLREGVVPMGYGLGRHGWCSLTLSAGFSVEQLLDWVDESYRAIAPKSLVKTLGGARPAPAELAAPPPEPEEVPRVLLVGAGPKRLQRAATALAAASVPAAGLPLESAVEAAGDLQPDAIVLDLGREAVRSRELAAQLAVVAPEAALWITGLRSAAQESAARRELPRARGFSREPPGDPDVLSQILAALADED